MRLSAFAGVFLALSVSGEEHGDSAIQLQDDPHVAEQASPNELVVLEAMEAVIDGLVNAKSFFTGIDDLSNQVEIAKTRFRRLGEQLELDTDEMEEFITEIENQYSQWIELVSDFEISVMMLTWAPNIELWKTELEDIRNRMIEFVDSVNGFLETRLRTEIHRIGIDMPARVTHLLSDPEIELELFVRESIELMLKAGDSVAAIDSERHYAWASLNRVSVEGFEPNGALDEISNAARCLIAHAEFLIEQKRRIADEWVVGLEFDISGIVDTVRERVIPNAVCSDELRSRIQQRSHVIEKFVRRLKGQEADLGFIIADQA